MAFASLRQNFLVLLLLPVALLLAALGFLGFIYARNLMLDRWRESAILSLERAAHSIDMKLSQPKEMVELLGSLQEVHAQALVEDWLVKRIRKLPGVQAVKLTRPSAARARGPRGPRRPMARRAGRGPGPGWHHGPGGGPGGRGMMFRRVQVAGVGTPRFDAQSGRKLATVVFDLLGEGQKKVGQLLLTLRFDYLLSDLKGLAWWQTQQVVLVDRQGLLLARRAEVMAQRLRLGEKKDPLELALLRDLARKKSGTLAGPGHPPRVVAGFYRLKQAPWTLVLLAQGDKVLAPIIRFRNYFLAAAGACIAIIVLLIWLVTGRVSGAVGRVSRAAREMAAGRFGPPLQPKGQDEIAQLQESFNSMVAGLKERDFIRDTFGRYVDPAVARELLKGPAAGKLGGERRSVAIMMTDIRGFTALCEALSPEDTISLINDYLSQLIKVIQDHQGIIVDFLGDAILAFFDFPEQPLDRAALMAVCCAQALQQAGQEFNAQKQSQGLPRLETGIGLHVGEVVVGNIGSQSRSKYGIVGAPVNLSHRVQAAAAAGETVVSSDLAELLGDRLQTARSFSARLKGVSGEPTLHVVAQVRGCPQGGVPPAG